MGVLTRDGIFAGHIATGRSWFWSPFTPLRQQWWMWYVVIWADGTRERSAEDCPPWSAVTEMQNGFFEWLGSDSHRGRYDLHWMEASEATSTRERLAVDAHSTTPLTPLRTLSTGGGVARAGEIAGRAVLVVPMKDRVWEFHDKPWSTSHEDQCDDSYWMQDAETATEWSKWAIEWVEPNELVAFIRSHWPEFDAVSMAGLRFPVDT